MPSNKVLALEEIVRAALDGTGRIIDREEEVGGYPVAEETRTEFDPNDWESLLEK